MDDQPQLRDRRSEIVVLLSPFRDGRSEIDVLLSPFREAFRRSDITGRRSDIDVLLSPFPARSGSGAALKLLNSRNLPLATVL